MIRTLLKFIGILMVFGVVGGLSAFFTISWVIKSEDTVVVPELEGKDAIDVLELLSDLGLNTKVNGSEYHETVPRNHIVHQAPGPGSLIKKGRDVSLILSKGTQQVTLPDISGRNSAQARIILEENGLTPGKQTAIHSSLYKPETVISQSPKPGEVIDRGASIDLLVSLGREPEAYKMPDLRGKYLDEAVLIIEDLKLFLDGATTVYDNSKPINTIIGQAPPAGYYIEEDRPVRLTINRNPGRNTGQEGVSGKDGGRLFVYRIPAGFLKQHIRLEFNGYGMSVSLYDDLMSPGQQVWAVIPRHTEAALLLYRNGDLIESEFFD